MADATVIDVLARRAVSEAERAAFLFHDEPVTFGVLWQRLERCAAALVGRGLEPGDRVLMALPNGVDFFTAFFGAQRARLIPVPVFPGSGPSRLQAMSRRCGARLAVVEAAEARSERPPGEVDEVPQVELRQLLAEVQGGSSALPFPLADDLAYLQYTSGSTGEPKGVQISHAGLLINMEQLIGGMEISSSDRFVSWLPVYHDMGLVLMSLVPFYLALPLALLPASLRHLDTWLKTIEEQSATFTAAPDFAYRLCLRYVRDPSRYDLSSLRVALNAAEPVRERTIRQFESAFGLTRVMLPAYGLAEATVGVSCCVPGSPLEVDERGFVSVGLPFAQIELAVIGDDEPVSPGEMGEIVVKSPAATTGYFGDPTARRELFWRDFLRTGDLGYLDRQGRLYVVGRKKNLIIHAGRNVAPQEVEEAVDRLDFVRYSAAVGVDRGGIEGEQIHVFAEVRRPHDREAENRRRVVEIVQAIHDHLGIRPGRAFLALPRTIPRTHNGKIRHQELKRRYTAGELRSAGRLVYPDY